MNATYDVIARSGSGEIRSFSLAAVDAPEACRRVASGDMTVLRCTPRRRAWRAFASKAPRRSQSVDVATFSYELASLLTAGLSALEALRTLAAKESNAARKASLLDLLKSIGNGLPLSAALEAQGGRFPPLLIASVSASEQTGDLSTSLMRYAQHQQTVRALRDKVVGAAIYPLLLLAVGCAVVFFLLTVVVPKFAVLIEGTRRELPWSSQLMMTWGQFAAAHSQVIVGGSIALVIAVVTAVRRTSGHQARSRWLERLPVVGPLVRRFRHAQLYRTTGMLIQGGIAAPRALQLASSVLGDIDRGRLARAVEMIREGRGLSAALQSARLADPVATSMLAVAERTGALAEILARIAEFHESTLARSVELASRLFEPVLMIAIGLVIGAIVVLMYLPIFDLASSLQ